MAKLQAKVDQELKAVLERVSQQHDELRGALLQSQAATASESVMQKEVLARATEAKFSTDQLASKVAEVARKGDDLRSELLRAIASAARCGSERRQDGAEGVAHESCMQKDIGVGHTGGSSDAGGELLPSSHGRQEDSSPSGGSPWKAALGNLFGLGGGSPSRASSS